MTPGHFHPLGATYDGRGVNFALFSEHATAVELCLFDERGNETRIALPRRTLHVWHGHVRGLLPGQRYGYRVHGPYSPHEGQRFNPSKLLVDPYARRLEGKVDPSSGIYAFEGNDDRVRDDRDDASGIPKCVVVADVFDWEGDAPPDVRWDDTVVYEMHVKGFTKLHPQVPPEQRGTFAGLGSPAAIEHLKRLGVTAVELLPVHEAMDEPALSARGMTNYWGYNTLAFFAPAQRFASRPGEEVREFKQMVKSLHAAGIEVILDVVYNHTCEGDHLGATVSLRGVDNRTYYRLKSDPRLYEDFTGCGNSLNVGHAQTLKLIMDSLRYWVTEMHVDGFRFDLASTLGRDESAVDRLSAFFDIIHQDPILSRTKLIAEPWDLGPGGYQVGNFPILWSEWNGRYRDTVRQFWTGGANVLGDLGYRLTGSSDLFGDDGRHPHASINFVTAHDGFTLRDLVSYDKKHNEANGEGNRDGWDDNASSNGGIEGDTEDAAVLALRARQVRNVLATLVFSQGVPMLTMGDEMGRTQRGNNNAYCQDNPISWVSWTLDDAQRELLAWTTRALALRRTHPVFRRRSFFSGERRDDASPKDIGWFRADGEEMIASDWADAKRAVIGLFLDGDALGTSDVSGEPLEDDSFLLLASAHREPVRFRLPGRVWGSTWEIVLTTAELARAPSGVAKAATTDRVRGGDELYLPPFSLVLLVRRS